LEGKLGTGELLGKLFFLFFLSFLTFAPSAPLRETLFLFIVVVFVATSLQLF